MKKVIISAVIMAFTLVSCNQKSSQATSTDSVKTEKSDKKYACPMHPEITGKQGDKCSKCGMDLTEEGK